jgi:hypothetical protein
MISFHGVVRGAVGLVERLLYLGGVAPTATSRRCCRGTDNNTDRRRSFPPFGSWPPQHWRGVWFIRRSAPSWPVARLMTTCQVTASRPSDGLSGPGGWHTPPLVVGSRRSGLIGAGF